MTVLSFVVQVILGIAIIAIGTNMSSAATNSLLSDNMAIRIILCNGFQLLILTLIFVFGV